MFNFFIEQNHIIATQKKNLEKWNLPPNAAVESDY